MRQLCYHFLFLGETKISRNTSNACWARKYGLTKTWLKLIDFYLTNKPFGELAIYQIGFETFVYLFCH